MLKAPSQSVKDMHEGLKQNRASITIDLYKRMNRKGLDVRGKHCAAFETRIRSMHIKHRHFQMSSSYAEKINMNISMIDKTDQVSPIIL